MTTQESVTVLIYADDAATREAVRLAIGRRPAADLPRTEFVECATAPAVMSNLQSVDVAILDGEAWPAGGMGICRQAKDEIYDCPPIAIIIGRRDDAWLASWSRADAVVSHPIDPMAMAQAVARLIRQRLTGAGQLPAVQ
jgi:CheY-like chemotaxis protein